MLECPAIPSLLRWLETYIVVLAALVAISSIEFGATMTRYFWHIAGALILGGLAVVLFHRQRAKSQTAAREYVIRQVAQELCRILEEQGGKSSLSNLKPKLHTSCRPYSDLAIALLRKDNMIE